MTRLATILAVALATMAIAASSAFAAPGHHTRQNKDQDDTAAIVFLAAVGALVAGSALVRVERKSRRSAAAA